MSIFALSKGQEVDFFDGRYRCRGRVIATQCQPKLVHIKMSHCEGVEVSPKRVAVLNKYVFGEQDTKPDFWRLITNELTN